MDRLRLRPSAEYSVRLCCCVHFKTLVKVKLASSDKPYKRVMTSIREMDIMFKDAKHERTGEAFETMKLVLCNRLDLIQDKDVFGPIRDKCPKPESEMLLNGVQKMGVESVLGCAPAGNAYCHGGPGTGKTHFAKELGKVFVRHPAAD